MTIAGRVPLGAAGACGPLVIRMSGCSMREFKGEVMGIDGELMVFHGVFEGI